MSASSLVSQGYYGYQGWGDREADADFAATHGAGKGGPSSSTSSGGASSPGANVTPQSFTQNPVQSATDIANSLRTQNIQAAQPAIQTLQSGVQPLTDRYNKLIESIKGQGATNVQNAGIAAAQEFGKRGIPLSSGAYDTFLQGRTLPVEQSTNSQVLGAEGDLQDKTRAIQSAIASLQSGAGNVDMSNVLNLMTTSKALATPVTPNTQVVEAGGRQLLIDKNTGQTIQDLGAASSASSGGGMDLSSLAGLFGGGNTTSNSVTEPKPNYDAAFNGALSPNKQWAYDRASTDWVPVVK